MMDLGASFKAKSMWDANWNKPRLDSRTGIHNGNREANIAQWWEVDMPGNAFFKVSMMTLMKRGDNAARNRLINAVQFQFSYDDGKNWHTHNKGKWYSTGQAAGDNARS